MSFGGEIGRGAQYDSRPDLDPGVSACESRGVGPGAAAERGSAFSLGV